MSLREYLVITFSDAVANAPPAVKKAALGLLKEYVDEHTDVWVGYDGFTFTIDEVIEPFFKSIYGLPPIDLTRTFEGEITDIKLTPEQQQEIVTLGFKFIKPGPVLWLQ